MQLVIHAPFGGRVNRAFGLALRKRFCVSFDFELQAAATDDAIVLSMSAAHSFPLKDAFRFVRSEQLDATLQQAVLQAPMFGTRWRWNASRALAVLRHERGKKVPPFLQRMRADDLLAAVFPAQVACQDNAPGGPIEVPDHPLVKQTVRDCLTEAMDVERLREILLRIEAGEITLHARDTTEPSPFSHEVLNAKPYAFLDDAPLEERRARALSLRRTLPEHQRDLGALDPEAIARVVAEARPEPRDADELHDALLGLVAVPIEEEWFGWLDDLVRAGRAARVNDLAFAMENAQAFDVVYFGAPRRTLPPALQGPTPTRDDALLAIVRGHAEVCGPFTSAALAEKLGLEAWEVDVAVGHLEGEGLVLRGRFTPGAEHEEVCDRRLLARIHRYTLDRLRSAIEPVSAQDFLRYLFDRHGLTARTRAGGRAGLRDAVAMLQGFEIAAAAWETDVLAPRVPGYRPEWLDELCLAGEVAWARLSPRRSASTVLGSTSRSTPITLATRRDLGWLLDAVRAEDDAEMPTSPSAAAALDALRRKGALFLDDLADATKLDRGALTDALWDLVGRGLVAGDGFQPLRDLLSSGRAAKKRGRAVQGRWALVERVRATPDDDLADRVAVQLLLRYGVVFRELVARESFAVRWRDVLRALRRREARGLVRGGRFIAGFIGEQYALPEAVDGLRRIRREDRAGDVVRVRASDPLNLVGVVTPGPRVPAHHGEWLVFVDGAFQREQPVSGVMPVAQPADGASKATPAEA
jgi:ATP-dependent Lhr-like helicase